jgi:DNA ligase-1
MIGSSSASSSSSAAAAVPKELRDAPLLPLARYNPLRHACWTAGAPAPYLALALTLAAGGQVAGLEGQPACQ